VRTLKTFQGTHILGASRGLLCDSYAVLYNDGGSLVTNFKWGSHIWHIIIDPDIGLT